MYKDDAGPDDEIMERRHSCFTNKKPAKLPTKYCLCGCGRQIPQTCEWRTDPIERFKFKYTGRRKYKGYACGRVATLKCCEVIANARFNLIGQPKNNQGWVYPDGDK